MIPDETRLDLDTARELARAGVPIFLARPALDPSGTWDPSGGHHKTGYWLPRGWQSTTADAAVLDTWRDGDAVCAVMGHTLDLVDVDPRHGGDVSLTALVDAGVLPRTYARASTPSGGTHEFVRSLDVASRDGFAPGIDVKAGTEHGEGRGFAFIAPTIKVSKATGEVSRYRWIDRPVIPERDDLDADDTGAELADRIRATRTPANAPTSEVFNDAGKNSPDAGKVFTDLDPELQARVRAYTSAMVERVQAELHESAQWPENYRNPAGHGWERLQADAAWKLGNIARASWCPVTLSEARDAFMSAAPTNDTWTASDVAEKWRTQSMRGAPQPWPVALDNPRHPVATVSGLFAPATSTAEPPSTPAAVDTTDTEVALELHRMKVRAEARRQFDAEQSERAELPTLTPLAEFLATPDDPVTYRIDALWPSGGRVLLAAQHKAGKSTLVGNVVRCLVDHEPLFDAHPVAPATRVVLLDAELDARMLRRWLRDQRITATSSVDLAPLRGRLSTFNILDPATRTRWAALIGRADVLVLDCLRPALDALGLSEDKDAGRFLEALDELATEAGIGEVLLVHHMGHGGERSRGDSRILDWPDAVWNLLRDTEDDDPATARRYFSAYGRDVAQGERLLRFDAQTRHLTVGGGSRIEQKTTGLLADVLDYLATSPGASKNGIEKALGGHRANIRAAIDTGIRDGVIRVEKIGQAHQHYLTAPTSPNRAQGERARLENLDRAHLAQPRPGEWASSPAEPRPLAYRARGAGEGEPGEDEPRPPGEGRGSTTGQPDEPERARFTKHGADLFAKYPSEQVGQLTVGGNQ